MAKTKTVQTWRDEAAEAAFYAAVEALKQAPTEHLRDIETDGDIVGSAAHHVLDQRIHDGVIPA